ncbi:DUF2585 domain-containing protein [Adhaeretor mobilis]|uniref:DUF2585 domain-containing protein n=1 Tax=Adhaeretor mobilis TaxID=1930276 RepID=UPI0021BCBCDA|nr:DUF2585 domain-containing protein [Adhaeretor mobilis]
MAVALCVLLWLGQPLFCHCGSLLFWISDAAGSHTSQHFTDPYSITHFQHGLVLCLFIGWIFEKWTASTRAVSWQLTLTVLIEAGWEVLENTPLVIDRYRTATVAVGYRGDALINSLGDIVCCILGWIVARYFGWRWTIVLFVAIEIALIIIIRDSLLLSILMLTSPVEGIREWQQGESLSASTNPTPRNPLPSCWYRLQ